MISRAMPEHQSLFQPLYAQYDSLAQNAQIKSRKMVDFLNELSNLIFHDMRKQAEQRIQNAVKSGKAVADKLSDSTLPYDYISDGITAIVEELDSIALENVTLSSLTGVTLETIHFAACMDILRTPQHRQLFDGITNFKEELDEAAKFFRDLTEDGLRTFGETGHVSDENFTEEKIYKDMAMQEGVVLFYLKGEVQKLGDEHLDENQKTAFSAICCKIESAIKMSHSPINEEKNKIAELLCEAYDELTKEAKRLNPYGGAIQYLAEKVKMPLKHLMK